MNDQLCPCGLPLHYSDLSTQLAVEELIKKNGPNVKISVMGRDRAYWVPRHFIALHGIKAEELPALAAQYNFKSCPHYDASSN